MSDSHYDLRTQQIHEEVAYMHRRIAEAEAPLKAEIAALKQAVAVARESLTAIRDGDIPRPVAQAWRADKEPSKNDRCPHDAWMYEDCGGCISEFAAQALASLDLKENEG